MPRRIRKTENGVRLDSRKFKKNMKRLKRYVTKRSGLPGEAFREWKRVTPRGETGKAKRSNKLRRKSKGYAIIGDYDYSGVIDRGEYPNPPKQGTGKTKGGYSRKNLVKARPNKGLVEPTLQYTIKRFKRFIRRLR